MSQETIEWLNRNTLIGFTEKRGKAWHYREGSSNHFEGPVPREAVLNLLSYPVAESAGITVPVITEDGVVTVHDESRKAIVRLDTRAVLGVFRSGYQIHQPVEWTLETLERILDGGAQIGSALVLRGGAVAAVQAELEETREAAEGVKFRPWLLAATSMDGSIASSYVRGAQVAVCDNTLSTALYGDSTASKVRVRHTSRSAGRILDLRERLSVEVEKVGDAFEAQVAALTSEVVSEDRWNEFVKAYTEVEKKPAGRSATIAQNKVAILNNLWSHDERVAPWAGSAYGVLAAVNTAEHHFFGADGSRVERNATRMVEGDWDSRDAATIKLLASV